MKLFKRFSFIVLAMLLCIASLVTSPISSYASGAELTVFAAASMTESMKQIADAYKKAAPDVRIVYNFDSSGTLKTQIEQGADCDIFISAGQKQMNELDIKADPKVNTKKRDFIMEGTRFNIVSNKVVLVVPKGHNSKGINDFKDVATDKVFLIALGNSDVPVGQYSAEIYKNLGLWDKLTKTNKISYGSNVKEVLSQVAAGAVDSTKTSIAAIDSVTGNLASNSVAAAQLSSNAVTAVKIAAGAVTATKTAIAAIDAATGNLATGSVSASQLVSNAVTAAKIAAGAVDATKTAIAAIDSTTGNLKVNTVNTVQLTDNAVNASKILAGAVTSTAIAASAVSANKLSIRKHLIY